MVVFIGTSGWQYPHWRGTFYPSGVAQARWLERYADPVELFVERVTHLGSKLGPVLLQLPATFRKDIRALDDVLAAFPRHIRVAFEPRHDSWHADDVASVLSRHRAAFCMSDSSGRRSPLWRTTNWGYVRFHAGRARPSPCYGPAAGLCRVSRRPLQELRPRPGIDDALWGHVDGSRFGAPVDEPFELPGGVRVGIDRHQAPGVHSGLEKVVWRIQPLGS